LPKAPEVKRGRYGARWAGTAGDLAMALDLRRQCFRAAPGRASDDSDRFDPISRHLLISDAAGRMVACCRVLSLNGPQIGHSYAAQFYDLTMLAAFPGPLLELGRFCLHPAVHDPDILRLAWAMLTRLVDAEGITLLFGCSSFAGTDPTPHLPALALLLRHLAPSQWAPVEKGAETVDLTRLAAKPDPRQMPPLLQTYLAMGAWVSDHAVIDRDLGTLHVFTGLEIAAIPPARARALRALAR